MARENYLSAEELEQFSKDPAGVLESLAEQYLELSRREAMESVLRNWEDRKINAIKMHGVYEFLAGLVVQLKNRERRQRGEQ